MRSLSVAEAKARLSAVLDTVQGGEDVVITKHGKPIARITAEPGAGTRRDPAKVYRDLAAFVMAQPMRSESAAVTVRQMRDEARY